MTFKNYFNNAWNIHAKETQKLMDEFPDHFSLPESNSDVTALANLIVHVSGEHLGKWEEGLKFLEKLKSNQHFTDLESMNRFIAILNLGKNSQHAITHFSPSDRARILAVTSSALASQNDLKRAESYLKEAHALTLTLSKEDPANRSLAITGNNLASALEEKINRSKEETELMKLSAHVARTFWEVAGGWMEVERAEYRLAQTYMKAGELEPAQKHAQQCLQIVKKNGNDPIELFFAYEVLTLISKALQKEVFDKLPDSDKEWCKNSLI